MSQCSPLKTKRLKKEKQKEKKNEEEDAPSIPTEYIMNKYDIFTLGRMRMKEKEEERRNRLEKKSLLRLIRGSQRLPLKDFGESFWNQRPLKAQGPLLASLVLIHARNTKSTWTLGSLVVQVKLRHPKHQKCLNQVLGDGKTLCSGLGVADLKVFKYIELR